MIQTQSATIFTVTEIVLQAKELLEQAFSSVWVEGEVSNLKQHSSGHWYFSLKDSSSQLRCAMFRGSNRLVRFQMEDGLNIRGFGRLTLYPDRGDFQMVVDMIEPAGLGSLQLAFEQLKQKLEQEGLFDREKKKVLPDYPEKIAVITSPTGAAIQDILNVIGRRSPLTDVDIYPVHVQGPKAAGEIAQALERLNELNEWDVIICARGGGSLEDLWAFNEEIVARAMAASKIPVISAVGHEVDYTIADFVADKRAETPTAAAELVVRDKREINMTLINLTNRLSQEMQRLLTGYHYRLEKVKESSVLQQPQRFYELLEQRLDDFTLRLNRNIEHYLKITKTRTYALVAQLNALSPLTIMTRGFSLVYRLPQKELIKSSDNINPGDELEIKLAQGTIRAKTMSKE